MRVSKRRQQILSVLHQRGTASVAELADDLGVSQNTIRNDLDALDKRGVLTRVRGGAMISSPAVPPQFRPKGGPLSPQADYIVDYAASWIQDGDSLILDDSALCVRLAERLVRQRHLRVITPSLAVVSVLALEPSNKVIIAGGEVDDATFSTHGSMAEDAIQGFRADKAFLSCTGVSTHNGLTEVSTGNAAIKRRMKNAADSIFVLVEADRIGKIDPFPVAELREARRIVTDDRVELAMVRTLTERDARVTICSSRGHETYQPAQSRTFRLGFANLSDDVWFAQAVHAGLERASRLAENVELLIADNHASVEAAVRNAQDLLRADIDLLIEYDGTGTAGRPIMRLARMADVPVVAIDIPITGATYFGSDHDGIGMMAGRALGEWIEKHWGGQLDQVLLLGGTNDRPTGDHAARVDAQTWEDVPLRLAPATRLDAALDALRSLVEPLPTVRPLSSPQAWATSRHAVDMFEQLMDTVLPTLPGDCRVAAICIVNEYALGLARAVRKAGRSDRFVAVSFGNRDPATMAELSSPDTCLLGLVDLGAERYGDQLVQACLRLLQGQAVPPAVFVEHHFLSRDEIR